MAEDRSPFDDDEVRRYFRDFEEKVIPNMKSSTMIAVLFTNSIPDAKLCLEVGAAVLLEKPLIVLATRGQKVPQNLLLLAAEIVEVDYPLSEKDRQAMDAAMQRVIRKVKDGRRA